MADANGDSSSTESEEREGFLKSSPSAAAQEKTQRGKMGCYDRTLASSIKDLKSPSFYRALMGEMLGVAFLVFVGCSSVYGDKETNGTQTLDQTRISLAFGISVATMVWCLANVSGGHINPAVSAGMFVTRKISLLRFLLYVGFQSIGGIIGSALQSSLTCNWQQSFYKTNCTLGLNSLGDDVSPGQGLAVEFLITFVLVFTVFATCDKSRSDLAGSGPLAIGLSVSMCHLAFIRITGSSMNSARSLGPAVVMQNFTNHWASGSLLAARCCDTYLLVIYWVGPVLGGVVAGLLYEFVFAGNASLTKLKQWLLQADYEEDEDEGHSAEQYELKRGQS